MVGVSPPFVPLAARTDVMVFQTPLLDRDIAVVGPLTVRLWVATDGPDTDFTAKLVDVCPPNADYPHGFALGFADGICRLRYADDPANPRLHEPGELFEIEITLSPTANLFAAGHCIRVDISSSNFPKFDVNTNTGEPEGGALRKRKAINTIWDQQGSPQPHPAADPSDPREPDLNPCSGQSRSLLRKTHLVMQSTRLCGSRTPVAFDPTNSPAPRRVNPEMDRHDKAIYPVFPQRNAILQPHRGVPDGPVHGRRRSGDALA